MQRQRGVNETGRSMVEMLGVLVIIGILSLSGITWYRYLVNKRMANDIVNEVKQRALLISAQRMATDRKDDELNESEFLPTIQGVFPTTQELHPHASGFFVVNVDQIPQDVCSHILKLEWDLPVKIYWNLVQDTDSYPHPQCPEGDALLSFVFDDELHGRSIPFNPSKRGCVSDEDCPVENCEICVYQQCERMCMGNEVCSSGSCDCPLNHFIDEETKECLPCPENMTTTTTNATACECNEPNVFDLNTGACVCPDGFYINNGVCTPCPEDTLGSVGPDATACLCDQFFVWEQEKCISCWDLQYVPKNQWREDSTIQRCLQFCGKNQYYKSGRYADGCGPIGLEGGCVDNQQGSLPEGNDAQIMEGYQRAIQNFGVDLIKGTLEQKRDPNYIRKKAKEMMNGFIMGNVMANWDHAKSWCLSHGWKMAHTDDLGCQYPWPFHWWATWDKPTIDANGGVPPDPCIKPVPYAITILYSSRHGTGVEVAAWIEDTDKGAGLGSCFQLAFYGGRFRSRCGNFNWTHYPLCKK